MKKEEIQAWIKNNLCMQDSAREITGQSKTGFNQSVATGKIKPFVEFGEARKTRLYLISDLEAYAANKKGGRNKMKTWKREGYQVVEKEFDGDLHEFDVIVNDEVVGTITPGDIEDMEQIITDLDNGEDVEGWEDGMGGNISIPED